MLPGRSADDAPTEGFLVVGTEVVHDDVFSAEPDGRIRSRRIRAGSRPAAGTGLRRKAAGAVVMDHVEAQAAAVLRRPGAAREANLVINNPPCDKAGRPLVCEKLLPHILPAGSRLNVYLSDGTSTRFYKTYEGTGEEIA
jgi:hypothetical protein